MYICTYIQNLFFTLYILLLDFLAINNRANDLQVQITSLLQFGFLVFVRLDLFDQIESNVEDTVGLHEHQIIINDFTASASDIDLDILIRTRNTATILQMILSELSCTSMTPTIFRIMCVRRLEHRN